MDPVLIDVFGSNGQLIPQAATNGLIEDADADAVMGNGEISGAANQAPPPLPPPQLHDIDLERIHADIYRDRYLTPDQFLEDIGKIVFNAEMRKNDDLERYHKAQAMYTATELSLSEFDPTLRLECARMAEREHQRRRERREARDKTKNGNGKNDGGNKDGSSYAPGTRRSARNSGLQPELSITDPVGLERKMKRQRSTEVGESCNNSGDDTATAAADDRASKRSRLQAITEEDVAGVVSDHDLDSLNIIGPTSSQVQPSAVRFIDCTQNNSPAPFSPTPTPTPIGPSIIIVPDSTTRPSPGFAPHLLNPAPPPAPIPSLYSHLSAMSESFSSYPNPSTSNTNVFAPSLSQNSSLQTSFAALSTLR